MCAEAIWATIYMYTNLALSAYILGSITLLVVKSDEAAGHFRDSANAMKQYTKQHNIPQVHCWPCSIPFHLVRHILKDIGMAVR